MSGVHTVSETVPVSRIQPHPSNIRRDLGDLEELAASIAEHGLLQPLVVFQHPSERRQYVINAGHRRFAAAVKAGLISVPVIIRPRPGRAGSMVIMLVENCMRSDLGPMEKAEAMGHLRDFEGFTATKIAKETGFTVSTVSYYLSLLELDASSRELVRDGQVPAAEAVSAVRQVHQEERRSSRRPGSRRARQVTVLPPWFGDGHRLADDARHLHKLHGRGKKLPGGVACGECWEKIIRQDEAAGRSGPLRAGPALEEAG